MSKPKSILVLTADRRIEILTTPPTWSEMQALVGGDVEQVRVLDRVEADQPIYTFLYVNEEGLLQGLPRNYQATSVYQRNVRAAFPGKANPFLAAKESARRQWEASGIHILEHNLGPLGYEEDPWIAGTAIYFEGWTCAEVTAYYAEREEETDTEA